MEEDDTSPVEMDTGPEAATTLGPTLMHSARARRPTAQYQQYLEQRNMVFSSELSEEEDVDESYYDALHEDDYRIQEDMRDPVAFMSAKD
jgi:hypothetical protein